MPGSCTAPRGCRAVKTTRLQCRRLTPPPAIVLITLAYSALGSRRVGRHCVLMLLVLFPFLFYTSTYPKVFLYPRVSLIGIKDFSEALIHLSFTRFTVPQRITRFPSVYTAQPSVCWALFCVYVRFYYSGLFRTVGRGSFQG